jgi:hypothetical protein
VPVSGDRAFLVGVKIIDACFCAAGNNAGEVSRYLEINPGLHNDIH